MPEIKNTIKTNSKSKEDSLRSLMSNETKFELPEKRRFSIWRLIFPVLLIAALVGGWFARDLVPNAEAPEAYVIEKDDSKNSTSNNLAGYYLAHGPGEQLNLYSYSSDPRFSDAKVTGVDALSVNVLGKYMQPDSYLVSTDGGGKAIQIFNVKTGKLETLVETGEQGYLRSVAVSSDSKWLAYGLTYEGNPNMSDLWLYNLETKEKKELIKKTQQQTYQGYSVLAWRNNDKELIVSALGGDAGAVWGDIYQVNVETGAATKVTPVPAAAMNYFIRGTLSPDGNLWAYTFCQTPEKNSTEIFAASEPCTTGTEIRTYDFTTKQTKTVFHNLRFDNNVDKNKLRSVLDMKWQNDKTLIAAIPGAIVELDVSAKDKFIDLLIFDRTNPQNFKSNYLSLLSVSSERIVFMRENGPQVFDRLSKKTTVLNFDTRGEDLQYWFN